MDFIDQLFASFSTSWTQVQAFFPQMLGALLLLVFGWLFAVGVKKSSEKILTYIRLNTIAERAGIENFLAQGGLKMTTVGVVSTVLYWFVLATVLLAALNTLGLSVASDLINKIVLYIPNVVLGILVVIFGTLAAKLVRTVCVTYLKNIGIGGAEAIGFVTQYAILVFAFSMALEQLNIGGQVLVSAFQLAFGGFCLAFALAFGLGGREWAAKTLEKLSSKQSATAHKDFEFKEMRKL